MAENNDSQNQSNGKDYKYFRTSIAGLSIQIAPAKQGEVAPEMVRFTPILQKWEGEMQKFGYLKTSNKLVIQRCKDDPMVQQVEQSEYESIMERAEDPDEPNVRRVA
jgi:hypothetical protein